MPGQGFSKPVNYKLWYACRAAVAAQMIAEGWNRHARKFQDVQRRRAQKLYVRGAA